MVILYCITREWKLGLNSGSAMRRIGWDVSADRGSHAISHNGASISENINHTVF